MPMIGALHLGHRHRTVTTPCRLIKLDVPIAVAPPNPTVNASTPLSEPFSGHETLDDRNETSNVRSPRFKQVKFAVNPSLVRCSRCLLCFHRNLRIKVAHKPKAPEILPA
jgi:hypothetical protein